MFMDEFRERLIEAVREKSFFKLTIHSMEVIKVNDTKYHAVSVSREGENIGRTFYLEQLYREYLDGRKIEDIADWVVTASSTDTGTGERKIIESLNRIGSFDRIRESVIVRLINLEWNREYLKDKCYLPYMDFAVCFHILMAQAESGTATVPIPKEIFSAWEISLEELYAVALSNMERIFPVMISPMDEVLTKLIRCDGFSQFMNPPVFDGLGMYILTNKSIIYGASTILYHNVLKDFSIEKESEKVIIIPSSVNEVIVIPDNAKLPIESESLRKMIAEVNSQNVSRDEMLSDRPYLYDRERDKIMAFQ